MAGAGPSTNRGRLTETPSGMIAYREFTREGFDVHMFERDNTPGGNWHYTEESPLPAPIPNADLAVGDYTPSLPPRGVPLPFTEKYTDGGDAFKTRQREHRQPKPVWQSLASNAPAITELPWPAGTPWELTHEMLQKYMRAFASIHGVNSNDENPRVSYNTRVELVEKHFREDGSEHGWTITLKTLARTGLNSYEVTWRQERFDAIVVATGRFNAPYIPTIPGLSGWNSRFGDRISHARAYRRPEPYANETILIVGAANSGSEIARDLITGAKKIYQSIRPDNSSAPHFELGRFLGRIPQNVTVIPEINRFQQILQSESFSDGKIELKNGSYHNSSIGLDEWAPKGSKQPLVTDGTHIRSLHLDLFYIEEPTIGFLNSKVPFGLNLGMQSFVYAEYLSLALAKVWSNTAKLPSAEEQWRLHRERIERQGGYGRHFQFLGAKRTDEMTRFFIGWLNAAAVKFGGRQIDRPPNGNDEVVKLWAARQFGDHIHLTVQQSKSHLTDDPFALDIDTILDILFNDNCYTKNITAIQLQQLLNITIGNKR
ncbi:hypothetical protein HWV62_21150 [Athelia sp. TMB]|nr:hypothetical protein HWV62_21150 [Athelia sp. TMB]